MERQSYEAVLATGSVIAFFVGTAVGGLVTYFATKNRIRAKADEEIEEVRDIYEKMTLEHKKKEESVSKESAKVKPSLEDIYGKYVASANSKESKEPKKEKPRIISMASYAEDEAYDKETLIFYEEDGVLTDQYDHVLDVDMTIGRESLNHFGEEEEDILYVRNDKLMTDYDVVLEHRASPPTALAEGDEDDD